MHDITNHLQIELKKLKEAGLYKAERIIESPQRTEISVERHDSVLNFCANNYLGLADNPELIEAARQALQKYGFGMASVRFIFGTQTIHKDLEKQLKQADQEGAKYKLIAIDGVFSMDGIIADLKSICELAGKYRALVMV